MSLNDKKQFQRYEPSRTMWTRASNACHMKSDRTLSDAFAGRQWRERSQAAPRIASVDSSDRTVVRPTTGPSLVAGKVVWSITLVISRYTIIRDGHVVSKLYMHWLSL